MQLEASVNFPVDLLDELVSAVRDAIQEEISPRGWFNVDAAADYLSLTPTALRTLVQRRAVPFHKPAGRLLFDPHELDNWVRGLQTPFDQSNRSPREARTSGGMASGGES
jgi:hypothetical protein